MRDFVPENLYFLVRYPDQRHLYLAAESVVFIGKNLRGDEPTDNWYFQDVTSYCVYGRWDFSVPFEKDVTKQEFDEMATRSTPTKLVALQKDELDQVADCEALAKALLECAERRARAGSA